MRYHVAQLPPRFPAGPLSFEKIETYMKDGSPLEEWKTEWCNEQEGIVWVNWPVGLCWTLEDAISKVRALSIAYANNDWRIRNRVTGEIIMAMIL